MSTRNEIVARSSSHTKKRIRKITGDKKEADNGDQKKTFFFVYTKAINSREKVN